MSDLDPSLKNRSGYPGGLSTDRPRRLFKRLRRRDVSQTYWAQEQDQIETSVTREQRWDLMTRHGDFSLAYSTAVQPRLNYVGDERGYIAYRSRWAMAFALGDLVAPAAHQPALLREFLNTQKRVSFCQVTRGTAQLLADAGFFVNEMGVDTTLDLQDYDFKGKEKEWLRYAANWSTRRGYRIEEASFEEVSPSRVESVSEAWRKTRTVKRKEVRFLNRPIVMQDEPDVRKFFFVSPENEVLAFIFLDPLYRGGEKVGYVTAIKRRHPDAPQYAEQAIMKSIIERLQEEGVAELKLGLSPMAWIEDDEFTSSAWTRWLFQSTFQSRWVNRYFYNVVGHADYKRRFRGREEKLYFATPTRMTTMRMLSLIGLCGVA